MIDKPVRLSHDDYDRYVAARQERDALAARLAEAEKWRDINQEIVEKLKVALRRPGTECSYVEWAAECRSAVDRLAEAERDAARYRWLRDRINFRDQFVRSEDGKGLSTRWRAWVHDDYRENPPASEHIDEYIDGQLRAAHQQPTPQPSVCSYTGPLVPNEFGKLACPECGVIPRQSDQQGGVP